MPTISVTRDSVNRYDVVRFTTDQDPASYYAATTLYPDEEAMETAARAEYERADPADRNGDRVIISRDISSTPAESRTVTGSRIGAPCTFAGSLKRQLATWRNAGCHVSALLTDPRNHHNAELDYLALRGNLMSYLPAGKPHQTNDDGTWSRENRQEGKPGKVIRRILTPEALQSVTDADLERFGNNAKSAQYLEAGSIQIVQGPEIVRWYDGSSYAPTGSPLNDSCMRHDYCADYIQWYADNPDVVRMAILVDDDQALRARALIWETSGGTLLDRIYGADDHISAFKAYAIGQGWSHKTRQDYSNKMLITDPTNHRVERALTVQMPPPVTGTYPYMDTFTYYDGVRATNDESARGYDRELTSLRGSFIDHDAPDVNCCESCGDEIDDDDTRYTDGGHGPYCQDCYDERYTHCERCGAEIHADSSTTGPDTNEYCDGCASRLFTTCEDCDEAVWIDDTYTATDAHGDTLTVCESCAANYPAEATTEDQTNESA